MGQSVALGVVDGGVKKCAIMCLLIGMQRIAPLSSQNIDTLVRRKQNAEWEGKEK